MGLDGIWMGLFGQLGTEWEPWGGGWVGWVEGVERAERGPRGGREGEGVPPPYQPTNLPTHQRLGARDHSRCHHLHSLKPSSHCRSRIVGRSGRIYKCHPVLAYRRQNVARTAPHR